jgi:hypothetical protein
MPKPQNGSPAKRDRAEFVRQAVKDAVREREYEQIREAYLRQPHSAGGGGRLVVCGRMEA